ncbi:uncharacterized protein LOC144100989 [Amblyomma americanum]
MANAGAYPSPGGLAQPNAMRFAFQPAQQAAYGTPKQTPHAPAPYTPVAPAPYTPVVPAPYTPVAPAPYTPLAPAPYTPVAPAPYPEAAQSQTESYMSTIWRDKLDKPTLLKTVMTVVLFLVLLTAAVVCVAILMNDQSASTTEATKDVFNDLSSHGKPDIYIGLTTPPKTSSVPPPAPTLPPEPETTKGSTAPPTISPRDALNERPMVCTMGSKLNSGAMLPDDGLCEYIFYDSMYKDGRNLLLNPAGFKKDLLVFLDAYNTFKTTAFGIGFAFKGTKHLKPNLKGSGQSPLAYFWDRGIFHFGILDTPTRNLKETEVDVAIDCLKEIDSQAETQRNAGHPSFIFFAVVLLNYTLEDHYERSFKNVYQPDVLIAQGHYYSGDNTFAECRVLPPTVVTRPQEANNSYQHDLTMAVDTIRKLSRLTRRDKRALWAVSVTMKGRWTSPLPGRPLEFLERCAHNPSGTSFGSYAEICHDPAFEQHFTYNPEQGAVLASHATERRVLSFDNEKGFCKKLCRIQGEQPDQRFGIAAFDLDYDDFSNTCASMNKYGSFSRLRALRRIVEFFRTHFKTDTDEAACLQIVV